MIGTDKVEPRTPVEAPALPARPAGRGGERRPRGQARGATRRVVREPVAPDAEESGGPWPEVQALYSRQNF